MYKIEERLIPPNVGIRCHKVNKKLTPLGICWHYTANESPTAGADNHWTYWHRTDTGAQYVIDQHKILQAAPDTEVIWHAGPSNQYTQAVKERLNNMANSHLIGVELCVNANWNEVYKKAVWLGVYFCQKYNFDPYKHFWRHYDCTKKMCPLAWADNYKGGPAAWVKFKDDVAQVLKLKQPVYFKDIKGHQAESAINALFVAGLVAGSGDSLFNPNSITNRAETTAMVMRLLTKINKPITTRGTIKFKDIPHEKCTWATGVINEASSKGIINGYQDHTFRPLNPVTRAESAVIIANLLRACGTLLPKVGNIFNDIINHWAAGDINSLTELGIFSKGSLFRPSEKLTRGDLAIIIYNTAKLYQIIKEN